ncbi:hypothetical protein F4809DRAFT_75566 [Biscogniauxia mediterranea]|nr:hypothetical protein F4809DRAFT_75566 [Biscogniauxia mediterranea]
MAPLLPTIAAQARSIFSTSGQIAARSASNTLSKLGPLAARSVLSARDDTSSDTTEDEVDPAKGAIKPQDINNKFVFVLFGLLGAAFVCAGIWFFFWAKNGGFYFREDDWDDYKSTVLRRKGPNGTILSGATPSTQLGGGSVYKDVDDGQTEYTGGLTQVTRDTGDTGSTLTGITGGVSDFMGRERRRQKREKKEREREKQKDRKNRSKSRRRVGEDGALVDEEAEAAAQEQLRAYRHEKAARVGGINKASEGSEWDGSTNPSHSTVSNEKSDLLGHQQGTPTKGEAPASTVVSSSTASDQPPPTSRKAGGIRKVYSAADRTANRENERMRSEARRIARAERAERASNKNNNNPASSNTAGGVHRDFSFQRTTGTIEEESGSSVVSASVAASSSRHHHHRRQSRSQSRHRYLPAPAEEESDAGTSDLGTKSYHHVIPGLSSSAGGSGAGAGAASSVVSSDYAEERRKKRGAGKYRRGE